MRALLLLVGGFLLLGGVVFTVVYVSTVNRLKATSVYQRAVAAVAEDPRVQMQLGRPIEPRWIAAGLVDEAAGYSEMTFRITGPNGNGTVRAVAERAGADPADGAADNASGSGSGGGGGWDFVFMDVACYSDFGVEVVTLVDEKPPTGPDLPEPTEEAKREYGVE